MNVPTLCETWEAGENLSTAQNLLSKRHSKTCWSKFVMSEVSAHIRRRKATLSVSA